MPGHQQRPGEVGEARRQPGHPGAQQPAGYGETFRDPAPGRGDTWYCIVGSLPEGEDQYARGAPFLYRSPDLIRWEYLHPLYVGPAAATSARTSFRCRGAGPGVGAALLADSRRPGPPACTRGAFRPQAQGTVDDGLYYAREDAAGRAGAARPLRLDQGGSPPRGLRGRRVERCAGAARVLRILPDGTLGQGRRRSWKRCAAPSAGPGHSPSTSGRAEVVLDVAGDDRIEVLARFAPGTARKVGLAVQSTDEIRYDREAGRWPGGRSPSVRMSPDPARLRRPLRDRGVR